MTSSHIYTRILILILILIIVSEHALLHSVQYNTNTLPPTRSLIRTALCRSAVRGTHTTPQSLSLSLSQTRKGKGRYTTREHALTVSVHLYTHLSCTYVFACVCVFACAGITVTKHSVRWWTKRRRRREAVTYVQRLRRCTPYYCCYESVCTQMKTVETACVLTLCMFFACVCVYRTRTLRRSRRSRWRTRRHSRR